MTAITEMIRHIWVFASPFHSPASLAPNSSGAQSVVGEFGCKGLRGQSRNIHSLGDNATLASPRGLLQRLGSPFIWRRRIGDVAHCAIRMLVHLLMHQQMAPSTRFPRVAHLNKDAGSQSKTQHGDHDCSFHGTLPVPGCCLSLRLFRSWRCGCRGIGAHRSDGASTRDNVQADAAFHRNRMWNPRSPTPGRYRIR
jgi:hypothetical protein